MKFIAIGLLSFGMLGAAIGVGLVLSAALNGIARNPEAEPKISKYIYVGAGLCEAMGLFALVVMLLLIFVVK